MENQTRAGFRENVASGCLQCSFTVNYKFKRYDVDTFKFNLKFNKMIKRRINSVLDVEKSFTYITTVFILIK